MHIKKLIQDQFQRTQAEGQKFDRLMTEMLELWSETKDNESSRLFLKQLILSYATAEKKLEELNQLKNKFLGIASHDLRNPLSSIMGFSEMLLEDAFGPLTEEQREYIQIINNTSSQMLAMVNELLDVSVIESGKLSLVLKEESIEDVIRERVRMIKPMAEKKKISLKEQYEKIENLLVDSGKIAQVVDNLISNAIKFSPPEKNVYINLDTIDNMARVCIKDEGPGLTEDDQAKLFGGFQRLSAQPTGGEKSTGLGLSIVKKIIEVHNGSLHVESVPGAGAAFSFLIPMKGL